MTAKNDKSDEKVTAEDSLAARDAAFPGQPAANADPECDHDWQPDGQTLTSMQWCCTKCLKIKRGGIDI